MAIEVYGQQQVEVITKQSLQAVRPLLESKKRRYSVSESCTLPEWRTMPAFPSPSSRFNFSSFEWPFSDSWILEPESPPTKRPKFISGTFWKSATKPLAPSNNRNSSSREKPSPVLRFANTTGVAVSDSDREKESTGRYGTHEKMRSSENGGDPLPEIHKREEGIEAGDWKFRVVATARCKSASRLASDVIGTIDFNENGNFFATGGIARKIRICSYLKMVGEIEDNYESSWDEDADFLDDDDGMEILSRKRYSPLVRDHDYASVGQICTPGKLGSVKWRPDGSDVIGSGDYDGVVMEWSVEHGHTVSEKYEHSGQRVWSLDYSKSTPTLSASSSADGTVRVWSRGMEKSVLVLRPDSGNSVCCAQFSPVADHLIAVASADTNAYLYDLRKSASALLKLCGHDKAVSYVRFLGKDKLVSASIDSTLKLWDISAPLRDFEGDDGLLSRHPRVLSDHGGAHLVRTFSAHTNVKNFVGLAVHRGANILACGSETDEVFVYGNSSTVPLLNHKFPGKCMGYSGSPGPAKSYVGAVCWRQQLQPDDKYSLVAANSDGIVQVLQAN